MTKNKILLTIGCSGSGKTTYAKELVESDNSWINLNRDEARRYFYLNNHSDNLWKHYKPTKEKEEFISSMILYKLEKAVKNNKNIIVSDTNLAETTINKWKEKAKEIDYNYEEKVFGLDLNIDDLIKRDSNRLDNQSVGKEVLIKQWNIFNKKYNFQYIPDLSKKPAVIVDIDGTVSTKSDKRSYYDYTKVKYDLPRHNVIKLVQLLAKDNFIIFLSGRKDFCYKDTYDWLISNVNLDPSQFILKMRRTGDDRNDRIIKQEIFINEILNSDYYVHTALDDRPRVIRMWKDINIDTVLDVSKTYYEF